MLVVALLGVADECRRRGTLSAGRERQSLERSRAASSTCSQTCTRSSAPPSPAVVILITGFERADPIVSLLIAALMFSAGLGLVRGLGRVFLEAAPQGLDPEPIGPRVAATGGVAEVHDLHVWEITSGFPALSAHVSVAPTPTATRSRASWRRMLHERFGLDHTTLQVDHAGERPRAAPAGSAGLAGRGPPSGLARFQRCWLVGRISTSLTLRSRAAIA